MTRSILASGIFLFTIILLNPTFGQNPQKYILEANVVDKETGQPIPLAHIQIADFNAATITDEHGWFRIIAPGGKYNMYLSHIAYQTSHELISIKSDTTFTFQLEKKLIPLEEVFVFAEKTVNLTPEKYFHASDYEIHAGKLLLIGHPSKRLKSYLYLAGLSGEISDTLPFDGQGSLEKDFEGAPWIVKKDSASIISIQNNRVSLGKTISSKKYLDSISRVILKWEDQRYFQDIFVGEKGLKTYYKIDVIDSLYIISDICDSILLYLEKHKKADQFARFQDDLHEVIMASESKKRYNGPPLLKKSGAEAKYNTGGSLGSRYITSFNEEPLIYGSGKFGSMDIKIPEISNVFAPIFMFKKVLIQIDYYNRAINFYNKRGLKLHGVPINFHIDNTVLGTFRNLFHPLIDEHNSRVYVWTQKPNEVELYQLNIETGLLIQKINLDKFDNIHEIKIHNGYLYFLHNEVKYPYATRLYSMLLKNK